ncbi:hypothetical protein DMB66_07715 [Actinoplanes sp. ATCC 53533]|uniref:YbaB/EbfC family nucleoid-associated protein n=1 Tax=Actinoplanes sp. ATCC 53533 TaxID=1288362 RepID=UPI000F7719E1|nr:YbaB/EbfC family nucleoid-associated protein [Actinoplanes sp. ATCC 53533]RSM70840.1 hypothetical protein DMB66_07715 [Actinoplanes sp. ATCC 53533]
MSLEDDLRRAQGAAQQAAWETETTGIVGVGHDESRLVRAEVDHADALLRLEIGARWWQSIGPDQLAVAVRSAYDAACDDRMSAWAQRTEARASSDVPAAPAPDPLRGAGPGRRKPPGWDEQVDELRRALDALRQARAELRQLRTAVQEQASREIVGRGPGGRVTVTVVGGRITEVEFNRRWLNEQPTGQALADAVGAAAHQAYAVVAQQSAAALATMPALAAARAAVADPAAVFRRLGLIE